MVCLGNICRSPLAEGILKSMVNPSKIKVASAGTANYHTGKEPDKRSIAIAQQNGIDISNQQAAHFNVNDFDRYDYIYAMDQSNYQNICNLAKTKQAISKVKLILNESNPGKNLEVPDPYYGGDQGFEAVFNMLEKACAVIASKHRASNL